MNIFETLQRRFAVVARIAGRQEDAKLSPTEELLASINSIESMHAPTLQKNVQTQSLTFNTTFDWLCLLAVREGPPAGIRTKFQLMWAQGSGVWVPGREKPEGGMYVAPVKIQTAMPLERALLVMAQIQALQQAAPGITPCALLFHTPRPLESQRLCFDDVRDLVAAYRELNPRHLTLVKNITENNFKK